MYVSSTTTAPKLAGVRGTLSAAFRALRPVRFRAAEDCNLTTAHHFPSNAVTIWWEESCRVATVMFSCGLCWTTHFSFASPVNSHVSSSLVLHVAHSSLNGLGLPHEDRPVKSPR
eukprot:scpid84394/ scgid3291/ 